MMWGTVKRQKSLFELACNLTGAIRANDIMGVNSWLRRGADPNSRVYSSTHGPLHHAAQSSTVPVILLLLACGSKINGKDVAGRTPAHWSIRNGRSSVNLHQLLESGAHLRATCNENLTLLHTAIMARNPACITTLFDAGLDLDDLKPSFLSRALSAFGSLRGLARRKIDSGDGESDEYGYYAREYFNDPEIGPFLRSHILRRKALQTISEDKKSFFK